jgi:diguanylate cyclase (GGDEF)-like protein
VMNVKPEMVVGHPFSDLVHPEDAKDAKQRLLGIARGDAASRIEFRVRGRSGAWHWLEATPTNLLDDQTVGGIVLNTRDVSDRHELEARLRRDALHDALTDLPNRVLLMDRMTHALDVSQRHAGRVALLFIDLDDFKDVNDSAGHVAGDLVLTVVADRLRKTVRTSDTVARFGGDEFAVLIDECESLQGPQILASKICEAVAEPIVAAGAIYQVRASVGVALSRDADVVKDLITRADQAMYQAKKHGKGRVAVYGTAGHEALG